MPRGPDTTTAGDAAGAARQRAADPVAPATGTVDGAAPGVDPPAAAQAPADAGTPHTPLAALGGAPLVTFAVALTGALLGWCALELYALRRRPGVGSARVGALVDHPTKQRHVEHQGIVRDPVTAGARAPVVRTDNATHGRTGQPAQRLARSRPRAVEHGRAVLAAGLPPRDDVAVPDRVGEAPEWTLAGLGPLAGGRVGVRGRRARREERARG